LGHSDIATTSKFYVDTLVDDIRDGMERVESRKESRNSSSDVAKAKKA